jgi:STE24 endopeptidase
MDGFFSLAFLALLAWLAQSPWFYTGLGVPPSMDRPGVALILFFLALPVFTFAFGPLSSFYSRRHEFEADAFAAQERLRARRSSARSSSCTRTTRRTLTPDPVYSAFHDSHPPAACASRDSKRVGGRRPSRSSDDQSASSTMTDHADLP